jgi:hypothetical protein
MLEIHLDRAILQGIYSILKAIQFSLSEKILYQHPAIIIVFKYNKILRKKRGTYLNELEKWTLS